jgi:hypothetical protein
MFNTYILELVNSLHIMNKKTESLETIAVIHCVHEEIPRTVALIEVDPLLTDRIKIEMAYELTRSHYEDEGKPLAYITDGEWWKNKRVTKMFPNKTCRSSYVGDQVLIEDRKYAFNGERGATIARVDR